MAYARNYSMLLAYRRATATPRRIRPGRACRSAVRSGEHASFNTGVLTHKLIAIRKFSVMANLYHAPNLPRA
ncbi:hypothetical protein [Lysobacter gummosus]|uniref:hypothetical protein n=1 Tax=Lysobacter gummosus TaxID=262324 RepID=UPI00362DB663